jgi:hypothetical protein
VALLSRIWNARETMSLLMRGALVLALQLTGLQISTYALSSLLSPRRFSKNAYPDWRPAGQNPDRVFGEIPLSTYQPDYGG